MVLPLPTPETCRPNKTHLIAVLAITTAAAAIGLKIVRLRTLKLVGFGYSEYLTLNTPRPMLL